MLLFLTGRGLQHWSYTGDPPHSKGDLMGSLAALSALPV